MQLFLRTEFNQSNKDKLNKRNTPGPLYNTLHYNKVLDVTLIVVGPQLKCLCLYILLTWIG